jgi:myosin I
VKRGDEEGWAPHNYLELVLPKQKATPAPTPPARRSVPTPAAAESGGSTIKPAVPSMGGAAAKPKLPIATGNKPALAPKPGTGGGKPPVPNATRPPAAAPKPAAPGGVKPSGSVSSQMGLAAAVRYMRHISPRAGTTNSSILLYSWPSVRL